MLTRLTLVVALSRCSLNMEDDLICVLSCIDRRISMLSSNEQARLSQ